MLKDENRRYFWNENNRLIGWQSNDQQEQAWMTYDGLGRLISETTQTVEFITKSDFVYDGWNLIQETTSQSGTEQKVKFFIWGEDLSGTSQGAGGVGGLLACQNDKDGLSYFLMDGNGNVLGLTDSMGRSQAQYRYDAFGNVSMQLGSNAKSNRFRFSTKRENERSGLLYYGYRHYDPVTGRWPSRDPIAEQGGVNLYGMVDNDTVNQWDYLGLIEAEFQMSMAGFTPLFSRANNPFGYGQQYRSLSWRQAKKDILTHFDTYKDGKLTDKDCPPFRIRIVGYSWGGWSSLILAEKIADLSDNPNKHFKVALGTLDPVKTLRGQARIAVNGLPPYVVKAYNVYQRNGMRNGEGTGPAVGSDWFRGEAVAGAAGLRGGQDHTNSLLPDFRLGGANAVTDHITITLFSQALVEAVSKVKLD